MLGTVLGIVHTPLNKVIEIIGKHTYTHMQHTLKNHCNS